MLLSETQTDFFEKELYAYTQSEEYKPLHDANNKAIKEFRNSLSFEQQAQFNNLINRLSHETSALADAAFSIGLQLQNLE